MNDEDRYKQGIEVRTEVLGEAHVGRSLENLNDFNEDFQNFISRFAWGEVWSCSSFSILSYVALSSSDISPFSFL